MTNDAVATKCPEWHGFPGQVEGGWLARGPRETWLARWRLLRSIRLSKLIIIVLQPARLGLPAIAQENARGVGTKHVHHSLGMKKMLPTVIFQS